MSVQLKPSASASAKIWAAWVTALWVVGTVHLRGQGAQRMAWGRA